MDPEDELLGLGGGELKERLPELELDPELFGAEYEREELEPEEERLPDENERPPPELNPLLLARAGLTVMDNSIQTTANRAKDRRSQVQRRMKPLP